VTRAEALSAGDRGEGEGEMMPAEHPPEPHREASKYAVDRLVIQFRVERAAKRTARVAAISFAAALILIVPWVNRPIIKLMANLGL